MLGGEALFANRSGQHSGGPLLAEHADDHVGCRIGCLIVFQQTDDQVDRIGRLAVRNRERRGNAGRWVRVGGQFVQFFLGSPGIERTERFDDLLSKRSFGAGKSVNQNALVLRYFPNHRDSCHRADAILVSQLLGFHWYVGQDVGGTLWDRAIPGGAIKQWLETRVRKVCRVGRQ